MLEEPSILRPKSMAQINAITNLYRSGHSKRQDAFLMAKYQNFDRTFAVLSEPVLSKNASLGRLVRDSLCF